MEGEGLEPLRRGEGVQRNILLVPQAAEGILNPLEWAGGSGQQGSPNAD